jgi:hypothetical protein
MWMNKVELERLREELMANPELLECIYPPEQDLIIEYLGLDDGNMKGSSYIALQRNEPPRRIANRVSKALKTIKSVMGL